LRNNVGVRRVLSLLAVVLLASMLTVPGAVAKTRTLTFSVRLIQEQTVRHHKASNGSDLAHDTFSTQLRLYAIGTVIGFPDNTPMGTMEFNWGPLSGNCSSQAAGCSGTTNISTFTKLPGGTITAGSPHVSLSKGIIVPIQGGTGIFKGATGSIDIAPAAVAEDIFNLTLPG
jgi:hypothetical protein